jgi:poly(ADP-ribose) glycohydrolase ARH3
VACRYWYDPDGLSCAAAVASRVTHAHRDALVGALLQALAVALCLRSDPRAFSADAFLAELGRCRIGGWSADKLAQVRALLAEDATPAEVAAKLGNGVLAIEAVPAALWAFLRGAPAFEAAIVCAARLGGDVDTICALTGALAGALGGRSGLPPPWLDNLHQERPGVSAIDALAAELVGRSGQLAVAS